MQESKDKVYLRHMLERVQQHKTSKMALTLGCGCMGACNCNHDKIDDHSSRNGDTVPPLRPAQGMTLTNSSSCPNVTRVSTVGMVDKVEMNLFCR